MPNSSEPPVADVRRDPDLLAFLVEAGLLPAGSPAPMEPLTGGVSSDIWKVETPERVLVVKRALARLRVRKEWNAPVSRNASEVSWLLEAAKVEPAAVPRVLAHDPARGAFAMDYLDPATHPVWKGLLLLGRVDADFAAAVGAVIAGIHAGTAHSRSVAAAFANDDTFHSIRLEPYLEATAQVHRELAGPLSSLSASTSRTKAALVHGDVSPKNILAGPRGPVLLDAECAWYGDPAFDLAFCLNHLLLKGLAVPDAGKALLGSFRAMTAAYGARVAWEPVADLERRAARLLPALLLARIDGKSPVEYVTDEGRRDLVRRFAAPLIRSPVDTLASVASGWEKELSK